MLDLLESYLARWTGRADWPATTATLDAQLKVGGGAPTFEGSDVDTSDVFTYEVEGKFYDSSVQEVLGKQNIMGRIGDTVNIQYNPRHPKQCYYAPARQLASRVVLVTVVIATALPIMLTVHLHG